MQPEHFAVDVSIVIAAYDAARTVRQAVNSALSQTYSSIEVIVCDDASTDETAAIVDSLQDERVSLIRNEINIGPGPSRDRAIESSRGRWISFMDADDIIDPRRIEYLVEYCKRNPNCIVFDDIEECHDTSCGLVPYRRVHGKTAFGKSDNNNVEHFVSLLELVSAKRLLVKAIIPINLIRKHGVKHLPLRYGEDGAFLWSLVARGTRLLYVPIALYQYRITPGSASINPQKHVLLAECFESILDGPLQEDERKWIQAHSQYLRDVAEFKSWRQLSGFRRYKLILQFFAKNPVKLTRIIMSRFRQLRYNLSRLRAGGQRR